MLTRFSAVLLIAGWMVQTPAYSAAGLQYQGISPATLSPVSTYEATHSYALSSSGLATSSTSYVCFVTGVTLPQAATIKSIYVYFSSNSSNDISIELRRQDMTDNTTDYLFTNKILDDKDTYVYSNQPVTQFNLVNNKRFLYSFQVCVISGTIFNGAIIAYVPKT